MKLICISDTHEQHAKLGTLPPCDVLIHAGDWTYRGDLSRLADAADWFASQHARYKVAIAGNHDLCFQDVRWQAAREVFQSRGIDYLEDGALTVDGMKFYGSPWQPEFCDWAFNLPRGHKLREKWALIPDDVDVLITHGPQWKVRDANGQGTPCGCFDLGQRIPQLKQLKAHVYGHIHEGAGVDKHQGHWSVNASVLDGRYRQVNAPIELEL